MLIRVEFQLGRCPADKAEKYAQTDELALFAVTDWPDGLALPAPGDDCEFAAIRELQFTVDTLRVWHLEGETTTAGLVPVTLYMTEQGAHNVGRNGCRFETREDGYAHTLYVEAELIDAGWKIVDRPTDLPPPKPLSQILGESG